MLLSLQLAVFLYTLVQCCLNAQAISTQKNSNMRKKSKEPIYSEEHEESENLLTDQLQNNYQTSLLKMIDFFQTTSLALTKINERLDQLERAGASVGTSGMQNVMGQIEPTDSDVTEIVKRFDRFQHTTTARLRLADLRFLSPTRAGHTFRGLTMEGIAAAVPDDYSLAVEIVNYLRLDLTDCQKYLPINFEHDGAPATVPSKTKEVFTFKQLLLIPMGVVLYRVGDTGFSLHLYFHTKQGRYAIGFLENNASVQTIWEVNNGCSEYSHNGNSGSFACSDWVHIWGTTRVLNVQQGRLYAQLTIQDSQLTSILSLEIFEFFYKKLV